LLFFAWWTSSFSWLWWLTEKFSKESICNFMGESFGFFDYWVTKNFALYIWKEMVGFKCPMNFALKNNVRCMNIRLLFWSSLWLNWM
jgi:hypothetical protein